MPERSQNLNRGIEILSGTPFGLRSQPRGLMASYLIFRYVPSAGGSGARISMSVATREPPPMAAHKFREARAASSAAAVGTIPPGSCARRSATVTIRRTRTSTWGSVSVWAAVAERWFFELMTERENGGKSRGRPWRGEGVRGFSRADDGMGVGDPSPTENNSVALHHD